MRGWLLLAVFIISGACCVSGLRINEVMPHSNNSLNNEWVEIYNDGSENINLVNWKIGDLQSNKTFNLTLSSNGLGIIADNDLNFSNKLGCLAINELLGYSSNCVELTQIGGYGLNDNGEDLFLFNNKSELVSNVLPWNNTKILGSSWQFYNGSWQSCAPTPGKENYCETQNDSTTPLMNNSTTTENTTTTKPPISLNVECENEIYRESMLDLTIDILNGEDKDYEIKAYISLENDTVISEIYNGSWKSGVYYINYNERVKIRLKKNYQGVNDSGELIVKLREMGKTGIITEFRKNMKIIGVENVESIAPIIDIKNSTEESQITNNESTIVLNNQNTGEKWEVVYESKSEKIKNYTIYAFCLFLIFLMAVILIKR